MFQNVCVKRLSVCTDDTSIQMDNFEETRLVIFALVVVDTSKVSIDLGGFQYEIIQCH